ncbi:MAG: 6-carboxytetrahydropterin synthase [Phycisphaerales bacterium]|nr:6-carboxytetrahydropterin synthase [Phycisphaerales bacterium]MCB9841511.1 6-carboxytetrahydropterin synthase [Phycisphaeraceae bacterium]
MYEITVQADFAAAHAIVIGGAREPVHGHNWHVEVTLSGSTLDADGLLCDFHTAEETLGQIVRRFHNRNLNDVAPFDTVNPSAEHVARHIAEAMRERLGAGLAAVAAISRVSVSEAPGCVATYHPRRP